MIYRLIAAASVAALAAGCAGTPETDDDIFGSEAPVVITEPKVSLPGVSLADDSLSARVATDLKSRAGAAFATKTGIQCNPEGIEIVDRTITTRPVYDNAPWTETWLVDACREDYAYRVNYFPNATGPTQYRASLVPAK